MAKKRAEEAAAPVEEAAPPPDTNGTGKKPGGRLIGSWRLRATQELGADASGEALRIKVDELAAAAGYPDYRSGSVFPAQPAARQPRQSAARAAAPQEEGEALSTLRTLVKLIGKEATKNLVDTL